MLSIGIVVVWSDALKEEAVSLLVCVATEEHVNACVCINPPILFL